MKNITFHFICTVWGDDYVNRYTQYSIPSTMNYGNLLNPVFNESEYHVYSPLKYHARIATALVKFPGKIVFHDFAPPSNKYAAMIESHAPAYSYASNVGAYTSFMIPDAIYSEAFFTYVYSMILDGWQAVQGTAIRMNLETYLHWYDQVKPKNLVNLDHIHLWSRACFWGENRVSTHPSVLQWRSEDCIITRCFHLHPYAVRPNKSINPRSSTCDVLLVGDACDHGRVGYINNSKYAHAVELSYEHSMDDIIIEGRNYSEDSLKEWANSMCKPIHFQNYQHPIITPL